MPTSAAPQPLTDRNTLIGMAASALLGARGFGPMTTFALNLGYEGLLVLIPRFAPSLLPGAVAPTFDRAVVDLATSMGAWWMGAELLAPAATAVATTEITPR